MLEWEEPNGQTGILVYVDRSLITTKLILTRITETPYALVAK
jgi:hypothetical protein